MSGDKNLFEQIAEIKADTEAVKNAPKTLREQLNQKDPKIFEFIADAELVWIYRGKSLQKKKEDKELKKQFIIMVIGFAIQLVLCILSAIYFSNYFWIGVGINAVLMVAYSYFKACELQTCKYPLKVPYKEMRKQRYLKYETDDNGITDVEGRAFFEKTVRIALLVAVFFHGVATILLSEKLIWVDLLCFLAIWVFNLYIVINKAFAFRWQLCLENKNYTIEYQYLNEFIYENNLRLKEVEKK